MNANFFEDILIGLLLLIAVVSGAPETQDDIPSITKYKSTKISCPNELVEKHDCLVLRDTVKYFVKSRHRNHIRVLDLSPETIYNSKTDTLVIYGIHNR